MNSPSLFPYLINARRLRDEQARAGGLFADTAPVSEAFSEDLHIVVSVDREGRRDFVRWSEVPRMSDEYLDVVNHAFANFKNALPIGEPNFIASPSRLTKQVTYSHTENSLLLVAGTFWRRIFAHYSGNVLAVTPSNDSLYIADAATPGARQELHALADKVFVSSDSPLSNRLVSFNGLGWHDEG